jgi:hypothetical protein
MVVLRVMWLRLVVLTEAQAVGFYQPLYQFPWLVLHIYAQQVLQLKHLVVG